MSTSRPPAPCTRTVNESIFGRTQWAYRLIIKISDICYYIHIYIYIYIYIYIQTDSKCFLIITLRRTDFKVTPVYETHRQQCDL